MPPSNIKTPISYVSPEGHMKIVSKRQPKATIGEYKQRFDVTKMNALNSNMWKKGIMFN